MKKSLLSLYLQKVAEGDETFADRLCSQLADRLIYVPVKQDSVAKSQGRVTVDVRKIPEDSKTFVPIFTSERNLTTWCEAQGHDSELISLLGADFCLALGSDIWLLIDPGTDSSVKLQPTYVKKIAHVDAPDETPAEVSQPPSSPVATVAPPEPDLAPIAPDTGQPIRAAEPEIDPIEATMEISEPTIAAAAAPASPAPPPKKKSFLDFLRNR